MSPISSSQLPLSHMDTLWPRSGSDTSYQAAFIIDGPRIPLQQPLLSLAPCANILPTLFGLSQLVLGYPHTWIPSTPGLQHSTVDHFSAGVPSSPCLVLTSHSEPPTDKDTSPCVVSDSPHWVIPVSDLSALLILLGHQAPSLTPVWMSSLLTVLGIWTVHLSSLLGLWLTTHAKLLPSCGHLALFGLWLTAPGCLPSSPHHHPPQHTLLSGSDPSTPHQAAPLHRPPPPPLALVHLMT